MTLRERASLKEKTREKNTKSRGLEAGVSAPK